MTVQPILMIGNDTLGKRSTDIDFRKDKDASQETSNSLP